MIVEKCWFADLKPTEIETVRKNQETVVVVDLWAATTNIVLMLAKRPARLILINDKRYQEAKRVFPKAILIGQSYTIPEEDFAVSTNLPFDIDQVNIRDKIVLYMSFNGSRVLEAFSQHEPGLVFTCAFFNYQLLANYLQKTDVQKITIVAAGNLTGEMGGLAFEEDWLGAELLEREIAREQYDKTWFEQGIKKVVEAQYPDRPQSFFEKEVWPFIFAPRSDILPTAFVNREGFVEVVDYLSRKGVRGGPEGRGQKQG